MPSSDQKEKGFTVIVITSIQEPTTAVKAFAKKNIQLIVVGDEKSPSSYNQKSVIFLGLKKQRSTFKNFAEMLPTNNYARKNIGYLYAMKLGAQTIIETDDDDHPYSNFSASHSLKIKGALISYNRGWGNIYGLFTKKHIWPRGLPLNFVHEKKPAKLKPLQIKSCPIQQCLADGDPDVDAIYRLTFPQKNILFTKRAPVILDHSSFCPFNSQNTVWFKNAFKLMYLPSFVSFRMTDIWRSFVAQVCLKALNLHISFHSATVYQDRNAHNLMKDFSSEIPGYQLNEKIMEILLSLKLSPNEKESGNNLLQCWEALVRHSIVSKKEIPLVKKWIQETSRL